MDLRNIDYDILGVVGLGITGKSACVNLCKSGKKIYAFDDNKNLADLKKDPDLKEFVDSGLLIIDDYKNWDWEKLEALLVSPGIPRHYPKPHPTFALAEEYEAHIISDMDLVQQALPNATIFGITGTNGKSTCSSLLNHMLKSVDYRVELGGNIGKSVLELDNVGQGIYVFEVSSFQLEVIRDVRFKIAVMLNISPDHQDRYETMDDYVAAKKLIFANQKDRDILIIGVDDINSMRMFCGFRDERKHGRIIPISCEQRFTGGVSIIDGVLYNDIDSYNLDTNQGVPLGDLPHLRGKHNGQNVSAAYAVAYMSGVKSEECIKAIKTYKGLKHRMQFLGVDGNITYVNDSKATNINATQKALQSYDNIYWIAGGRPKDKTIKELYKEYKNIAHAYLIGEAKEYFAQDLEGKVEYTLCDNLEQAFMQANLTAKANKEKATILLSPACSSYDQFKNFEERGDKFIALFDNVKLRQGEKIG